MAKAPAGRRSAQAVKVGSAKTGKAGQARTPGYGGRISSGSRGGLSDPALNASSKALGRSAPGTGLGGTGSAGGATSSGGVTETTTGPGGISLPTTSPTPPHGGGSGIPTPNDDFVPRPSITPVSRATSANYAAKAPAPTGQVKGLVSSSSSTTSTRKPIIAPAGGGPKSVASKPGGTPAPKKPAVTVVKSSGGGPKSAASKPGGHSKSSSRTSAKKVSGKTVKKPVTKSSSGASKAKRIAS